MKIYFAGNITVPRESIIFYCTKDYLLFTIMERIKNLMMSLNIK